MTTDTNATARHVLRSLLNGGAPNGVPIDDCGQWASYVSASYDLHATGGSDAVKRYLNGVLKSRDGRGLASLLAGHEAAAQSKLMPELPECATEVYQHEAPCGRWLGEYVAFANQAAPMTPQLFHEAAGLFAASMAIARRVCFTSGARPIYPNLYFLFVSPSTIDHKSTGLGVLRQAIRDAGISHLLLPQRATPQALVADLDHAKLPTARQLQDKPFYLARRAFAAQRGWVREEASALFASFNQEFNTGLLELILDLYDCEEDGYEELTVSRGESKVERPYLSFFGVSTPIEMAPHFSNMSHWNNGLWARCLALIPDGVIRPFHFFPKTIHNNGHVVQGLRHIYEMFPIPQATLESVEKDDGKREQVIRIHSLAPPHQARLAPGVWDAWEIYSRVVMHTMLSERAVEEELYACYGRFSTLAMKIALLLATMDAEQLPITIELRHYVAAQQCVENWRTGIHRLWANQSATNETRLMDRILKKLGKAGATGMTVRDLCIGLRQTAKDVGESLTLLSKSGKVASITTAASNGRQVEVWTCV